MATDPTLDDIDSPALAPVRRLGSRWWLAAGLTAGLTAAGLTFVLAMALHHTSALHDTDSYFHLAIARLYAEQGIVDDLPALRLSLLRDGYGDKEFLFHLSLVPWVQALDPLAAGRWALAAWSALLAGLLAALASRVLGKWGWLWPLALFWMSTELGWRLVRLRPELLSLVCFLLAAWALAAGRHRLLAPICCVLALGYTAVQAMVGFVGLAVLVVGLAEEGWSWRRWPWVAALYGALGAGLGLILHPHFPKNLVIWWVQNVQFFVEKGGLNVGSEIRPNTTDVVLMVHLGLFAALAALFLAAEPDDSLSSGSDQHSLSSGSDQHSLSSGSDQHSLSSGSDQHSLSSGSDQHSLSPGSNQPSGARAIARRFALVFGLGAVIFGLLYLLMSRFSLYFWPFFTLACLFSLPALGKRLGPSVRLPGARRLPLAAALVAAALLSAPEAWRQFQAYREKTTMGPAGERVKDRELLAAQLPPGAKVAADWGPTATYLLWADHALFLNALDPIFMALPYPEAQKSLRQVLDGEANDVPGLVVGGLDSDYLAFPSVGHEALTEQLRGDPRVALRHRGSHTLVAFGAPATDDFVTDWYRVPPGTPLPPDPAALTQWQVYPRPADPRLRAVAGYLAFDLLDTTRQGCGVLARPFAAGRYRVELAFRGLAEIWLGDQLHLRASSDQIRLGEALVFPLDVGEAGAIVSFGLCARSSGESFGAFWRQNAAQLP